MESKTKQSETKKNPAHRASQVVLVVRNLPDSAGDFRDMVRKIPWREDTATDSSIGEAHG